MSKFIVTIPTIIIPIKKRQLIIFYCLFASVFLHSQTTSILKYDVKARIDSVWGAGWSAQEELRVFDSVWTVIDQKYACFQNLDLNWNAVKEKYRPEIALGVSRGRFGAIISQMSLSLKEPHTKLFSAQVSFTKPKRGVPLLAGSESLPGALLTPLSDSTLLVYKTILQHPLGISPGDIVVGYDNVPLKQLYHYLLKNEIPLSANVFIGGNNAAYTHGLLQAVGSNWQLFDTIDIVKYHGGDTVRFSTRTLDTMITSVRLSGTEQISVPGIPFPENIGGPSASIRWGIVQGTNIGYVYVWSWLDFSISENFYNALDSLIRIYNVSGLILDFRSNNGGYVHNSDAGLSLLFRSSLPSFFLAERSDPSNHFTMRPAGEISFTDDSVRYFDKPIAVLTGPHCLSACDFISLRLKEHPRARFFGLTTASGYASLERINIDSSGVIVQYAFLNGYKIENGPKYLTHEEFLVDEKIWHTPGAAAKREDAVVNAALTWIQSLTEVVAVKTTLLPVQFSLEQNFPNPFNPLTTITFLVPEESRITITVYDALGRTVKTLISEEKLPGKYILPFDATGLSSGIYFYTLRSGSFSATKKMIHMK